MNIRHLSACVALLCISTTAQAAYNVYNQDGLSLDINGQINVFAHTQKEDFKYLGDVDATGFVLDNATQQYVAKEVLVGALEERQDRRVRLGQDMGASYIDFRGSQKLDNGLRVTGTVGLGYYDRATGMYLSNANVSIDKQNLGAISLGRQYLHTGFVGRTHTYTPLQTFSANSVRADYIGLKDTHISGYYSLPASADVRRADPGQTKGFGLSASHKTKLGNGDLRSAFGYSNSRFNADDGDNYTPIKSQGALASLEYRQGRWLVAGDVGRQSQQYVGTITDKATTNYLGAKVGVSLTPRLQLTAGVGTKNTSRQNIAPTSLSCDQVADPTCAYTLNVYSDFLFDKVKESRGYARLDYYLRDNVRVFGRADTYRQKLIHQNKGTADVDRQEFRAGVSLAF